MRDIILGRKVGSANTVRARRSEKHMVEACERHILECPVGMDAREVAFDNSSTICWGERPKPSVAGFGDAGFVRFIQGG